MSLFNGIAVNNPFYTALGTVYFPIISKNLSKRNAVSRGPPQASGWNCTEKAGIFFIAHALARSVVYVVEIFVGDLGVDCGGHDRVAMVLAGDVDAAGLKILHRLVCAAVAVLELFGLKAVCKRQQLVTEQMPKSGLPMFIIFLRFSMTSMLSAGSPGPFESITPSMLRAFNSSAVVLYGHTMTSAPRFSSSRRMFSL